MIRTRGLAHVELAVRDLAAAVEFYADVFGFEVVALGAGGAALGAPAGAGTLALRRVEPGAGVPVTTFGLALVDAADLDAAVALVVAAGGSVVERVVHAVGASAAVVTDRDGHRISL